jgi:hypothetical protein
MEFLLSSQKELQNYFHPFCAITNIPSVFARNLRQMITIKFGPNFNEKIGQCFLCEKEDKLGFMREQDGKSFHAICAWLHGAMFSLEYGRDEGFETLNKLNIEEFAKLPTHSISKPVQILIDFENRETDTLTSFRNQKFTLVNANIEEK